MWRLGPDWGRVVDFVQIVQIAGKWEEEMTEAAKVREIA